jgi:hypothetical protein
VFSLVEVVGGLSDDRDYSLGPRRVLRLPKSPRQIDGLIRAVRNADEGNRNNILFWAACRAAEARILELAAMPLREAAVAAGLNEVYVDATLRSAMRSAR